uniref:Uncharacterized protein n=1 Tax=Arundo donax TaxID=35708 RepID=A0A0A8ZC99_ARUDO
MNKPVYQHAQGSVKCLSLNTYLR